MSLIDEAGPQHATSVLSIDLGAVKSNYKLLAKRAKKAVCAAVVKANGYGLGAEQVAQALTEAGCTTFFVATLDEAIALRAVQPGAIIYYLNGLMPGETDACAEYNIRPVLNDPGQLDRWAGFRFEKGVPPAALQIDTGLSRLGLTPKETEQLIAAPERLANIDIDLVISHLACGDTPDHPLNKQQRDAFAKTTGLLPVAKRSLAASSGIFLGAAWHFDMVRAGAALYGVTPNREKPNPMAQVVHLQAKILQVRDVDTPQTVGYGATRRITGPTKVATVAAGYADGLPRSLGNEGTAYIGKIAAPVIGRVSMDLMTLDISDVPDAKPGDMVDLIGPLNDPDMDAEAAGTIGYEILTRLGRRYRRRYIETAA
ncbi:MAG: alanine racemase [Alphaproteobacteria bacterium]|nr:alanine racemase [Alphaproteobacteria bacterium]